MNVIQTALPGVLILEPQLFGDHRGFFLESYQEEKFNRLTGDKVRFVQDNHSGSAKNVLRGLHYQIQQPQGKLIRVVAGAIYDVAVDVRRGSPHFGQHVAAELSAENRRMLWVPAGFAHGFLSLADWNEVLYKATDFYAPQHERSLLWNDPEVAIPWPLEGAQPLVSAKDASGALLRDAEVFDFHLAAAQLV
jgi:dTDP-4-dehydrorhamnose 3,5-epimerase